MNFLLLYILPSFALATNFADCDGDVSRGCMDDTECTPPDAGSCEKDPANPTFPGCCPATATTTTTVATTAAAAATTTLASTCVDKLNPLTGVSDCPARASLCTNSVYLEVMRDQCPRTCNFCSSTGTGSTNTTTTTCVDQINPTTRVSDCPAMRAYCNNAVYKPLMTIQCPATCGFCTSG